MIGVKKGDTKKVGHGSICLPTRSGQNLQRLVRAAPVDSSLLLVVGSEFRSGSLQ